MTSTPAAAENSFATPFGIVKSRPRNEIWVASSLTRTTISRTSKTPRLRRSLLPMSPQSACVWRRSDRTVQLFRLPRSLLWGGGRRWGLRSPAAVVSSSGGVNDSWASARPRTRRSKSPADASRSMSTTPSARSWKFPVSKMKHYLTWWANSMQSRVQYLRALGMLRDRPADHERQCVRLQGLLKVSRGWGGKNYLGANITKLFDGATDREKPGRIVEKRCTAMRVTRPAPTTAATQIRCSRGQVGNLPGTSKQQLRIRSVLDVPADPSQRPPSTAGSAPPAARLGRR